MRCCRTISHRLGLLASAVLAALSAAACDGTYRSPVAPPPPPPRPAPDFVAHYTGDAVLRVDTRSAACGEEPPVGTISGWYWDVAITGDSILLTLFDEWDQAEYPGTLTGQSFVATVVVNSASPVRNCEWREVWVSGTFAEDFGSFEAYQTYVYGPPEAQTTHEWRWSARRRD